MLIFIITICPVHSSTFFLFFGLSHGWKWTFFRTFAVMAPIAGINQAIRKNHSGRQITSTGYELDKPIPTRLASSPGPPQGKQRKSSGSFDLTKLCVDLALGTLAAASGPIPPAYSHPVQYASLERNKTPRIFRGLGKSESLSALLTCRSRNIFSSNHILSTILYDSVSLFGNILYISCCHRQINMP